jgi:iron complex outermembrane recepter protein
MKRTLLFILILLVVLTADGQSKKRDRVKRKYRDVEQVQEALPRVVFRGMVRDGSRTPLPGAAVEIDGLKRLVHSNEEGRFRLTDLPTGRVRIRVSCLGYRTKTVDFMLQEGYNDHYIALDRDRIALETVVATSQNREQHGPDIPVALSVLTRSNARQLAVDRYPELTGYVPGLFVGSSGLPDRNLIIHGASGNSVIPDRSPSVAFYADQVPVAQPGGFSPEFFDMDRIEVLKGPQNTFFGREALKGAVHFVSRKPSDSFGGFITAGTGSFRQMEVEAAVNLPVVEDMLFVRAAGIYRDREGYVKNSAGGTLNGMNAVGGRFSLRFLPAFDHKVDLQLNYQQSDAPGEAFLNRWKTGDETASDLFSGQASLNRGETLGSRQEWMDATLTYRYTRNEHNHWTSVSSFRKNNHDGARDGDGTALPALEQDFRKTGERFFQEIRYDFMRGSRLNGSAGVNYLHETGHASQSLLSNDQYIYAVLTDPASFLMPGESRFTFFPHPLNPDPMGEISLTGDHYETGSFHQKNRSAQAFIHFTRQWLKQLFITGGGRAFYDRLQLINDSVSSGGEASSLGQLTGASPNLIINPSASRPITKNSLAYTGSLGLIYRPNQDFNLFLHAVRGRKPPVLQITPDGRPLIAEAEKVNSLEAGWKTTLKGRIYWEVTGFYRKHLDVQTTEAGGSTAAGLITSDGKATSYGVETGVKAAVLSGLDLFGNYAWLQSVFDSTGMSGNVFPHAGNSFALMPEHNFSGGLHARMRIARNMHFFVTPWYTWKSRFWFSEANTRGMEQAAYGLLHVHGGVELPEQQLRLSVYGTNLLDQPYFTSAGYLAGLPGLPVFMPGAPRMAGVRVTWRF